MKWIKRGLLFNPEDHQLPEACTSFAQSPQALIFDDFVRIYFSTRRLQYSGQYLSYISFVDVDRSLQRILRTATTSVIPLGGLGCFDEHGIFPINVVRSGTDIYAFLSGWSRRISVPVETAIGLAISRDEGFTFERLGPGPIMASTPAEPFLVGDPFVLIRDGRWHMWYIMGTSWTPVGPSEGPARVYKIAHANSSDGRSWERNAAPIITNALGPDECQALPTVFQQDGIWHMYFCFRQATNFRTDRDRSYRLGYAFSHDMVEWQRDDANGGIDVSASGWDSDMLCYPHAFRCDGETYLLYNGNEFGRAGFGVAVLERP